MSRYLGINFQDTFGQTPGASWNVTAVDTGTDAGKYVCIDAVDANIFYVSFYDGNGNLQCSKTTDGGNAWKNPLTTYVDTLNDVGQATGIVTIDANTAYISYYDATSKDLKFAKTTDGSNTWDFQTLDRSGDIAQYHTSIDAYDANNIFIAYPDQTNQTLKIARSTDGGSNWSISTVASDSGQGVSLRVYDANNIFISMPQAYYYNTDLKIARSTDSGSSWSIGIADSGYVDRGDTSIALADVNNIFIAYRNATSGYIMLAKSIDSGSNWSITTINSFNSGGGGARNLGLQDANTLYLSYATGDGLSIAKTDDAGLTWSHTLIDSNDVAYTALAVAGNPYIAYEYSNIGSLDLFFTSKSYSNIPLQIISESLAVNKSSLIAESRTPRFEAPGTYEGYNTVSGGFNIEGHPIDIGHLIKAWTGAFSSTAVSSVYQHVFIPATTDFSVKSAVYPISIDVYRDVGSVFTYYDMLADNFTLEFAYGALVKSSIDFMGGKYANAQIVTPAYSGGKVFAWDTCSLSLDGVAVDSIINLSFSFSNNLKNIGTLDGTKTPNRTKRDSYRTLDISGIMIFEDMTQYEKYSSFVSQRMILYCAGKTIGNGENSLMVDVPKMLYSAFPIPISSKGILQSSFSAKAEFDETSNYLVQITLTNTKSGY